jgi:hypothetical protein
MDATSAAFRAAGVHRAATAMDKLTLNDRDLGFDGSRQLKIQHSNDDGGPFRLVMLAEPPILYSDLDDDHLITKAHRYFFEQVSEWLVNDDPEVVRGRADTLAST